MKTSRRLLIAAQLLLAIAYTLPVLSSDLLTDSDFLSFYTAAVMISKGDGPRVYDLNLQRNYQAEILRSEGAPNHGRLLPFINPPYALFMLKPLAYFPLKRAALMFLVFNGVVVAWVVRRLWQLAGTWTQSARVLLITTFLGTEVLWYGLATRTMSLVVLACLLEYYLALRDTQKATAGIFLMVAALKPQLILLPAVIPLAKGHWRLLGLLVGVAVLVAMIVSLQLGFQIWLDYFRLLREVSAHGPTYGASPLSMNNLRTILHRTVPSTVVAPLVYLALMGSAIVSFYLWRSVRDFGLLFALTVLLGLFVAPHLNYQDTLIAVLPAAITFDFAQRKKPSLLPWFQAVMLAATFLPPLFILTGLRTLRWIWPLPLMLVLAGLCVRALRSQRP